MTLTQGRYWRASLVRSSVVIEVLRSSLPDELASLRDLRFEVPLRAWNRLVKHVHSDRKLLGGLLLDFANNKDRVSAAIGSDRLLTEFQRISRDSTATLVGEEVLALSPGRRQRGVVHATPIRKRTQK
jgi:hypothetical protein